MTLHRASGRAGLGASLALTTMVFWGVLPLALKIVVRALDPVTIVWFRFGVASLALGGWLAGRGRLPSLDGLGGRGLVLLAVAIAGLAANFYGFMVGLDLTTPGNAQVLIQLGPLLLALGGMVVFGERFARLQWIGLVTLAIGLVLFFASQLRLLAAELDRYLVGSAMLVLAAAMWATYGLAQKQLLRSLRAPGAMLCIYAGCFVLFSARAAPAGIARLQPTELGVLLFCAANTLVGYGSFAGALEHWEASRVAAVLSLTPLATLGFALLGAWLVPELVQTEAVSPWTVAGAATVVAGSMLVALGGRAARARAGGGAPVVLTRRGPTARETLAEKGTPAQPGG